MASLPELLASGVDTLMDRTVAPGFTRIGPAVRSRLPGWPEDPSPGCARREDGRGHRRDLRPRAGHRRGVRPARGGRAARRTRRGRRVRGSGAGSSRRCREPRCTSTAATSPTSTTYAGSRPSSTSTASTYSCTTRARCPPTRTESAQGHELTMALHVLGPVLMTELLRARAGRPRRPDDLRDLGRDVRPGGCAPTTRSTARGDYSADHRLRPQQAGPGRAAAGARAPLVGLGHRGARHPPGLGRHPGRGRVAARGSTG